MYISMQNTIYCLICMSNSHKSRSMSCVRTFALYSHRIECWLYHIYLDHAVPGIILLRRFAPKQLKWISSENGWIRPTDRPCRVRNSWPPTHLMRCSHPSQWGDESYIRQTKHTHTQTIARHRSTEVEFQFAPQFALNYNWHGITFPARRRRSFAFSEAS